MITEWRINYCEVQKVKKRSLVIGLLLMCSLTLAACGKKEETEQPVSSNTEVVTESTSTEVPIEPAISAEVISDDEIPAGKVVSDLTGEFIDESLEKQRPIAVMVDNDNITL